MHNIEDTYFNNLMDIVSEDSCDSIIEDIVEHNRAEYYNEYIKYLDEFYN